MREDAADLPLEQIRDAIPLRKVPELLPKRANGKRVSMASVWRAALDKGDRRLPTTKIFGQRYVTPGQLREWISRQSRGAQHSGQTPRQQQRRSERAAHLLAKEGL